MCAYSCSTKPITKTCRFTTCAAIPVITTLSCLGIEVVVLRLGYLAYYGLSFLLTVVVLHLTHHLPAYTWQKGTK